MKTWKIHAGAAVLAATLLCLAGVSNPGQLTQYFYGGITNAPLSTALNDVPFTTNNAALDLLRVNNGSSLTGLVNTISTNTPSLANVLAVGRNANGISITNLADAATPQGAATLFQTTNAIESARISAIGTNVVGFTGNIIVYTNLTASVAQHWTNGLLIYLSAP